MKDSNACEDLLLKYSDAMVIAAYEEYVKEHGPNLLQCDDESLNRATANKLVENIVDQYVLLNTNLTNQVYKFKCKKCGKEYVTKENLLKHQQICKESSQEIPASDSVQAYSKNALMLTFLINYFIDARKYGDGERILKLYKYFLLYFKAFERTKYAFQSLHLLSQVNYLLPPSLAYELKWNRFVNNKGGMNNIELDRCLEHRNKYVKEELKSLRGKLTEKSIDRVSKSYDKIRQIIQSFDLQTTIYKPSGKHSKPNWENDVKELAESFSNAYLLGKKDGREHTRYPDFPSNLLNVLNQKELTEWIITKIMTFKRMNIYKNKSYCVFEP